MFNYKKKINTEENDIKEIKFNYKLKEKFRTKKN
jgi:hypothetical protein